jgi:DNA-binding FadR family transcriptional regulator
MAQLLLFLYCLLVLLHFKQGSQATSAQAPALMPLLISQVQHASDISAGTSADQQWHDAVAQHSISPVRSALPLCLQALVLLHVKSRSLLTSAQSLTLPQRHLLHV